MSRRNFSDLRIPSTLPVELASDLCGTRFESEQLYRLCLPSNSTGRLMRLTGGELEGLLTTTVMGPNGIEGTAGLKPVAVTSISPLLTLRHLQLMSDCIEGLTGDLNRLHRQIYEHFHADVESSITALADIAPRIDEALLNDPYRTALLTEVRRVKGLLWKGFELELKDFSRIVDGMCDSLRNSQYSNACINNISYLGKSDSFSILTLLSICELFEIMLFGSFSENMMQASSKTLGDQRNKVLSIVSRYYDGVVSHLDGMDEYNRYSDRGRDWHEARVKEHSDNLEKARKEFDSVRQPSALLEALLNGDATKAEELWFFIRDGRINMSSGRPFTSASVKMLKKGE